MKKTALILSMLLKDVPNTLLWAKGEQNVFYNY